MSASLFASLGFAPLGTPGDTSRFTPAIPGAPHQAGAARGTTAAPDRPGFPEGVQDRIDFLWKENGNSAISRNALPPASTDRVRLPKRREDRPAHASLLDSLPKKPLEEPSEAAKLGKERIRAFLNEAVELIRREMVKIFVLRGLSRKEAERAAEQAAVSAASVAQETPETRARLLRWLAALNVEGVAGGENAAPAARPFPSWPEVEVAFDRALGRVTIRIGPFTFLIHAPSAGSGAPDAPALSMVVPFDETA